MPEIKYVDKTQYVKIIVPNELFFCESLDVNVSNVKTQADVALLLTDITELLEKCSNKNKSIYQIYLEHKNKQPE